MIKTTTLSATLRMVNIIGITAAFQGFFQFAPTNNSTINVATLSNGSNNQAQVQGCLPGEKSTWPLLYAKTKLHKVIVKYIPAQTQGMAAYLPGATVAPTAINFSQAAVMYTIPVYDNVDEVLDPFGVISVGQTVTDLEKQLVKPYCRAHSIYKPWTRVLSPKLFMKYGTYENDDVFRKSGGYVDMANDSITMNGLYIGMEPLSQAGLVPGNTGTDANFPAEGQAFVLGELQFTIYQSFKTRT